MKLHVSVELRTLLLRFAPTPEEPRFSRRVPAGTSVADLAGDLGIPAGWLGLITANGQTVQPSYILQDGDQIILRPLKIAGG